LYRWIKKFSVFFYDVRCAVVMHYYIMLIILYADMLQTVWNELDYRVNVCRITKDAPVSYITKTWSVVSLNKKYTYSYLKCIVFGKLLKP
jgi:hypothetical protein